MTVVEKQILQSAIMSDGSLFDELGDAVAEAVVTALKRQSVQDFFTTNEICCPHCNQHIESKEVLQDLEQGATIKEYTSTSPTPADPEELKEAKNLLAKVNSWSDREVEQLPLVARKKVRQYRRN